MNLTWGMIRDYGIHQARIRCRPSSANNPTGYVYASNNDQVKLWQEYDLTLWYRPIEALKFGLQYAYERSDFLQKLNNPTRCRCRSGAGPAQRRGHERRRIAPYPVRRPHVLLT